MGQSSERDVLFFDIDNCLYSRSNKVIELMGDLIDQYFQKHLALTPEESKRLHLQYYKDYGLAIEGLVRHHKVDPLDFNSKVDDALPLDEILVPDKDLRAFLESIDTSKVKLWLLTNAYITHGQRVVKLLGVDDLFEGITYCDYGAQEILAKPHSDMFRKAMKEAGVDDIEKCYFIDDSGANVAGAHKLGWKAVHFVEPALIPPSEKLGSYQVSSLKDLRIIFPQFFREGELTT